MVVRAQEEYSTEILSENPVPLITKLSKVSNASIVTKLNYKNEIYSTFFLLATEIYYEPKD